MKTYQIAISSADLPYVMEAITLRAVTLQQSINSQILAIEEAEQKRQAEARRAAMPDPFDDAPIVKRAEDLIPAAEKLAKKPVSRKHKRAMLMRTLKSKGAQDLSTAEIARRAGVSYVTAHNARKALKKGKK